MRVWFVLSAALIAAAIGLIFALLLPPERLSIAAGPAGGGYVGISQEYQRILARDGIRLDIVETEGSVENARLISEGRVEAALLQGGIPVESEDLEAVGTIFFEPLIFVIHAASTVPRNPAKWEGLRINSGAEGSGTLAAFQDFEKAVGLSHGDNVQLQLPYDEALQGLLTREIDIATFVSPLNAPYLLDAYESPELDLLILEHADAIARRLEYATVVDIPTGGLMLDPVVPVRPRKLVALEARLAITPDLHPALVNRLTMAAIELHSGRSLLAEPGRFPSTQGTEIPLNNAARQLIQEGPSTWHDWLPYWIAAQINRGFLLFLPFFFIVVPLVRSLPAVYAYMMRRRIWRHYPEIKRIESEIDVDLSAEQIDKMLEKLDAVEQRLSGVMLPAPYRQVQYDARLHVDLVQKRLTDLRDRVHG